MLLQEFVAANDGLVTLAQLRTQLSRISLTGLAERLEALRIAG